MTTTTTEEDPPPPASPGSDGEGVVVATAATKQESHEDSNEKKPPSVSPARRALVLLGSKPRGMYECDYCSTDLSRAPRIRCANCPDFDLCLECFATEDHERMAQYKREEESRKRAQAAAAAQAAPA